jgi:hypothetical protein
MRQKNIFNNSEEAFLEYCHNKEIDIDLLFGYVMANLEKIKNIQEVYFATKKLDEE